MNSNRKGKQGERELAAKLREYGLTAKRGQQHKGGTDSADVEVKEWPDIHIECKRTEKFQLYPSMKQAIGDCGDKTPVVIHRRNESEWVAIVRLEDFVKNDMHSDYFFEQVKKWKALADEAELALPELMKLAERVAKRPPLNGVGWASGWAEMKDTARALIARIEGEAPDEA